MIATCFTSTNYCAQLKYELLVYTIYDLVLFTSPTFILVVHRAFNFIKRPHREHEFLFVTFHSFAY